MGDGAVLSIYQGYLSWIDWLEPDRSLVAYNGIDDAFGVMVVHLQDETERQIVDFSDIEDAGIAIHPTKHMVLVSEYGHLVWYDSRSNEVERIPWPDGG